MDHLSGLASSTAAARLREQGYNELPSDRGKSLFTILWEVVSEPMLLLLLACGVIYFLMNESQDAYMLLFMVALVISITFYQQHKTERTLSALKDLASPKAIVVRDGIEKTILSREVVGGDVLAIKEGDRVPADGALISQVNLSVDESVLTGESVAVYKPNPQDPVYAGTLVIHGHAMAEVTATGTATKMGQIGRSLEAIKVEDTLLQRETRTIVNKYTLGGLGLCALVVAMYALVRHNLLEGVLAGLTLSMSILPEESG